MLITWIPCTRYDRTTIPFAAKIEWAKSFCSVTFSPTFSITCYVYTW